MPVDRNGLPGPEREHDERPGHEGHDHSRFAKDGRDHASREFGHSHGSHSHGSHSHGSHSHGSHSHGSNNHGRHTYASQRHNHSNAISGRRIFWVTILNLLITVAEAIGGLLSGSLALLSDSLHNLSDTVAVALSYFANRVARRPKNPRLSYGYKRVEILAALLNSMTLLAISIFLIFEAVERWRSPAVIDSTLMLVVAVIGLVADLFSVFLLERDARHSLNIRSSYLHMISDTASSVGVIIGALAIRFWGVTWIDPLVTMLIAAYIIFHAWRVLHSIVDILMQTSANLDYDAIRKDICAIEPVHDLHHVHTWMINESTIFFEAHIEMDDMPLSIVQRTTERIEQLLVEKYGISHVTLQAETEMCDDEDSCRI